MAKIKRVKSWTFQSSALRRSVNKQSAFLAKQKKYFFWLLGDLLEAIIPAHRVANASCFYTLFDSFYRQYSLVFIRFFCLLKCTLFFFEQSCACGYKRT